MALNGRLGIGHGTAPGFNNLLEQLLFAWISLSLSLFSEIAPTIMVA